MASSGSHWREIQRLQVTIKGDLARNDLHSTGISNFSEQVPCQLSWFTLIRRAALPALLGLCVWAPGVRAQSLPEGNAPSHEEDDAELTLRARILAGYESKQARPSGAQRDASTDENGFLLDQVRIGVRGELSELFRLSVSVEISDALSPKTGNAYTSPNYLRTASLEYRPSRAFRLRVGRFKRPFSRIELESRADLPILDRGLFNDLALEENQWGDRAVGMRASGRLEAPKLRWYLSLTNPTWRPNLPTDGVDVIGRVQWSVMKGLSLGVNAGYKNVKVGTRRLHHAAYGADVELDVGEAELVLELSSARLTFEPGAPRAQAALLLFRYLIDVAPLWALQPTFFAEVADANAEFFQSESIRLVGGVNLLGHEDFRIIPQVAVVRSLGDTSQQNPWLESETYSLIFSLVL